MDIGDLIKVVYNEFADNSKVSIKTGIFKGIKQDVLNFIILDCDGLETLIPETRIVRIENMEGMSALFCPKCKFYNWYKTDEKPPKSCKRCRGDLHGFE